MTNDEDRTMKPSYTSPNGRVRLFWGDCLKILPRLPAGFARLVCTDPPYGMTCAAYDEKIDLAAMWTAFILSSFPCPHSPAHLPLREKETN